MALQPRWAIVNPDFPPPPLRPQWATSRPQSARASRQHRVGFHWLANRQAFARKRTARSFYSVVSSERRQLRLKQVWRAWRGRGKNAVFCFAMTRHTVGARRAGTKLATRNKQARLISFLPSLPSFLSPWLSGPAYFC